MLIVQNVGWIHVVCRSWKKTAVGQDTIFMLSDTEDYVICYKSPSSILIKSQELSAYPSSYPNAGKSCNMSQN